MQNLTKIDIDRVATKMQEIMDYQSGHAYSRQANVILLKKFPLNIDNKTYNASLHIPTVTDAT